MKIDTLIKTGLKELATATPATMATPKDENTPIVATVATVATVAVMECSELPPKQSANIKEATEERKAILEYESGLDGASAEEIAKLAEDFYTHLFGVAKRDNCCNGRARRFCSEGQRLKDAYYASERRRVH